VRGKILEKKKKTDLVVVGPQNPGEGELLERDPSVVGGGGDILCARKGERREKRGGGLQKLLPGGDGDSGRGDETEVS